VGTASVVFMIAVISPFALLVVWGVPDVNPNVWLEGPAGGCVGFSACIQAVQWRSFVAVLLWNTSGYDDAAATAEEVAEPAHVYPRSLFLAVLVVSLSYLLPVMVGVGISPDIAAWDDGHFADVVAVLGHQAFSTFLAVGGTMSGLGQLNALLCSSARELVAMVDDGLLPQVLAWMHPQRKTPWVATLGFAAVTCACMTLSFDELVAATVFFDTISFSFQFISLAVLKYTEPEQERPFCVPGGVLGAIIIAVPPVALCVLQLYLASWYTWAIGGISCTVGIFFHFSFQRYKGAGQEPRVQVGNRP